MTHISDFEHRINLESFTHMYVPTRIFVLFQLDPKNNNMDQFYIEQAAVKDGKIKDFKPLSKQTAKELTQITVRENINIIKSGKLIKYRLLYYDISANKEITVWYEKPELKTFHYKFYGDTISRSVICPGLVMKLKKEDLYVFAVKDTELKEDTKLFQAPFPNINDAGKVCVSWQGSMLNHTMEDLINKISNNYWHSKFTTHNMEGRVRGSLKTLFDKLKDGDEIPLNILRATRLKLKDFLK